MSSMSFSFTKLRDLRGNCRQHPPQAGALKCLYKLSKVSDLEGALFQLCIFVLSSPKLIFNTPSKLFGGNKI